MCHFLSFFVALLLLLSHHIIAAGVAADDAPTGAPLSLAGKFILPATARGVIGRLAVDEARAVALVIVDDTPIYSSLGAPPSFHRLSATTPGQVCLLDLSNIAAVKVKPATELNMSRCIELKSPSGAPVSALDITIAPSQTAYVASGSRTKEKALCRIDYSSAALSASCVSLRGKYLNDTVTGTGGPFGVSVDPFAATPQFAAFTWSFSAYAVVCRIDIPSLTNIVCDVESTRAYIPFGIALRRNHTWVTAVGVRNAVLCRFAMYGGVEFDDCAPQYDSCTSGSALTIVGDTAYVACETSHSYYSSLYRIVGISGMLHMSSVIYNPRFGHSVVTRADGGAAADVFVGTQSAALASQNVQRVSIRFNSDGYSYIAPSFCLNVSNGREGETIGAAAESIHGLAFAKPTLLLASKGSSLLVVNTKPTTSPTAESAPSVCHECSNVTQVRTFYGSYMRLNCGASMYGSQYNGTRFNHFAPALALLGIGLGLSCGTCCLCCCAYMVLRRRRQAAVARVRAELAANLSMQLPAALRPVRLCTLEGTHEARGFCPLCLDDDAIDVAVLEHAATADDEEESGGTGVARFAGGDISEHKCCVTCREKLARSGLTHKCFMCRRKIVVVPIITVGDDDVDGGSRQRPPASTAAVSSSVATPAGEASSVEMVPIIATSAAAADSEASETSLI
jgi:hypothetical protein